MFKKDAPLYIKPRAEPSLLKWLMKFAFHCRQDKIRMTAKGCSAMMQGAIGLYADLIDENRLDCEWNPCGALHLYTSEKEFKAYRYVDKQVRQFGSGAIPLDKKTLSDLEPAVRRDLAGAWFSRNTALLRPDHFMAEFRRLLLVKGVDIKENVQVAGLKTDHGRAISAVTPQGDFDAGHFVIATGAWTPLLGKVLGCRIPIQPGKGYSTTFRQASGGPSIPCFFESERVVATPWPSGLRLGGVYGIFRL